MEDYPQHLAKAVTYMESAMRDMLVSAIDFTSPTSEEDYHELLKCLANVRDIANAADIVRGMLTREG